MLGHVLAAVALEEEGKEVGEKESDAAELTVHSNRMEEGRKEEVDVQGRRSGGAAMAAGGERVDLTGEKLKQARGGAAEVWDDVGEAPGARN